MRANFASIVLLAFFAVQVHSQNLVPNPSFENFSSCPTNENQVNLAIPWFNPTGNSSDYFNACYIGPSPVPVDVPSNFFGYQFARTGNAYTGLVAVYTGLTGREYIEVKLLDSLLIDRSYCVTFYVSLADSSSWATSRIGAYFSTDSVYNYSTGLFLNYVPQVENLFGNIITDAANWTKISGVFTAAGGEKYMTIGNFYDGTNTDTVTVANYSSQYAYFYIDDVSVYELPTDSTNCFDGVGVEEVRSGQEVLIYPNPVSDKLIVRSAEFGDKAEIIIYDLIGEKLFSQELMAKSTEQPIDVFALAKGVYFLQLKSKEGLATAKFIKE